MPLNVIPPDEQPKKILNSAKGSALLERKIAQTASYERRWKNNPESFDHSNSSIARSQFEQLKSLVLLLPNFNSKKAVDLGCGTGQTALWLCEQGMLVDAVDIASIPLEKLRAVKREQLTLFQDYVPFTKLEDDKYDLVICNDLIANLHPNEYRMLISELARIVNANGRVICSTPLDVRSENPLDYFTQLVDTELEIEGESYSYDLLNIRLLDFLALPQRLANASSSPQEKAKAVNKRRGLSRFFFNVLSFSWLYYPWKGLAWLVNPLKRLVENSNGLRSCLEKATRFLWQEQGITHVFLVTKRRSLVNADTPETPHDIRLPKQKRFVWE